MLDDDDTTPEEVEAGSLEVPSGGAVVAASLVASAEDSAAVAVALAVAVPAADGRSCEEGHGDGRRGIE